MRMISELLKDLSSLQTEMAITDGINSKWLHIIERAKVCIKFQCEKLQAQKEKFIWIPYKDLEPNKAGVYLCTVRQDGTSIFTLFYDGTEWISLANAEKVSEYVTAWQPLPDPWRGV